MCENPEACHRGGDGDHCLGELKDGGGSHGSAQEAE